MVRERPTDERMRMAGKAVELIIRDEKDDEGRNIPITTYRMLDGSILDLLVKRNQISGDEYHAGARFYNDWYTSGLANSGVIDPSKDVVDGGGRIIESDIRLAAMNRYHKAVKAMCTAHGMVMQCCVLAEESLEGYGRRIYRQASAKLAKLAATTALKDALHALNEHYNGKREHRMGSAHADGYRPTGVKLGIVKV
jgi:hypothetical protein